MTVYSLDVLCQQSESPLLENRACHGWSGCNGIRFAFVYSSIRNQTGSSCKAVIRAIFGTVYSELTNKSSMKQSII